MTNTDIIRAEYLILKWCLSNADGHGKDASGLRFDETTIPESDSPSDVTQEAFTVLLINKFIDGSPRVADSSKKATHFKGVKILPPGEEYFDKIRESQEDERIS